MLWITAFLLLLVFGVLLLTRTEYLARRSFPFAIDENATGITSENVKSIAFSVLGVALITTALPGLGFVSVDFLLRNQLSIPVNWNAIPSEVWARVVSEVIRIVFGVLLVVHSYKLTSVWDKYRR
jgi:hypothetical protein